MLAEAKPRLEEEARSVAMRILAPEALDAIIREQVTSILFESPLDIELDEDEALIEAEFDATHDITLGKDTEAPKPLEGGEQ